VVDEVPHQSAFGRQRTAFPSGEGGPPKVVDEVPHQSAFGRQLPQRGSLEPHQSAFGRQLPQRGSLYAEGKPYSMFWP
ncbi:MAG: hypothetical protein IJL98_06020, partial [Lachnospiraceae bacterium]|nr:hypothetical protein [Lachnospiraceae bacterium]